MPDFLLAAACFILLTVTFGLARVLHGPAKADRMMAAQLLGSGGVAVLLLLASVVDDISLVDTALVLALLAALASIAFVKSARARDADDGEEA